MTRSIIKAAEWMLGAETADGAPQAIYSAVCIACGAEAPAQDNERLPVEVWTLKHTGLNPTHRQYKATAETYWRVTPTGDNPYRDFDAQRGLTRQQEAARMRWRGASFQHIAAACGYVSADDARADFEAYEAARLAQRKGDAQGA